MSADQPRSGPHSFLSLLTGSFATPAAENPTVAMIEAAYRRDGLDARYINCDVAPVDLRDAVRGARASFTGKAITALTGRAPLNGQTFLIDSQKERNGAGPAMWSGLVRGSSTPCFMANSKGTTSTV